MYKHTKLATHKTTKHIDNQDLAGKHVLIRTCLNVTLDKQGKITDDTRIRESLPTLKKLGELAERVVMLAHLGRPTTKREAEFSLEVVRELLEKGLEEPVVMLKDEKAMAELLTLERVGHPIKYFLVENIRYFAGEESKDKSERMNFAKELAKLGDIFVNDAFADYRAAASTYELAELLPSYLGPVFSREIAAVNYFAEPQKPFVAVLGGAKLSEKLDTLAVLAEKADKVLIGGAMAYTLMKAQGMEIGKSLVENDKLEVAKELMQKYAEKIVLPMDHLIAQEFAATAKTSFTETHEIPKDQLAIDIGPKTQADFQKIIASAGAVLWNGPMGVFEWEVGETGTKAVGEAIIANKNAYKFAGGGDSIAAINKFGLQGFDHISTGGGAMLAFVAYETFPTLDIILNKD